MAKSRLATIETLTMPRLELNAAVIGVKLFNLMIYDWLVKRKGEILVRLYANIAVHSESISQI